MTVDTIDTSKDNKWDLLEFLNINPPEEIVTNGQDNNDLNVLPDCPELTNIESEETLTENANQRDQETPTKSVKAEREEEPKRKRRRTATDCRVEWRVSIANEKAEIIENVDIIVKMNKTIEKEYNC